MAHSEAGSRQMWRVLKGTGPFRSICHYKALIQLLLASIKQTGALWQDTMCLLKKPKTAGDRHIRELRDTKLCGLLDLYFFKCFPLQPYQNLKNQAGRQIDYTAISASSYHVMNPVTHVCPMQFCGMCWLVHAVRTICGLVMESFIMQKEANASFVLITLNFSSFFWLSPKF